MGFDERNAHHLSGGEKKRAAIAAMPACRPRGPALDARGARAVSAIILGFAGTRLVASQDLYSAG